VFILRDTKLNELLEEYPSCEDLDYHDDSFIAPNYMDINMDKSPQEKNSPT